MVAILEGSSFEFSVSEFTFTEFTGGLVARQTNALKATILKYRISVRGDMIEVFKITHNMYYTEVLPNIR